MSSFVRFHLGVLGALALVTALSPPMRAGEPTVPPDHSLKLQEFRDLGIADPSRAWTDVEFDQALRALGSIPRRQLPRAGSSRSALLFERLVLSFGEALGLSDARLAADPIGGATRSLEALYAETQQDDFFFDRELVAIRSEALAVVTRSLSDKKVLADRARRFAEMARAAESEAIRRQRLEEMRHTEMIAKTTAALVKRQTTELLVLLGVPQMTDTARRDAMQRLEELAPGLSRFLPEGDLHWIASVLKGAASNKFNAVIRARLEQLSSGLERVAAST